MTRKAGDRPLWQVRAPFGGAQPPWPQLIEIGQAIPHNVLGALVLKGAAYQEDSRERERHIDDAAILSCAMNDPVADRARMAGSDRKRVGALWKVLQDVDHPAWLAAGRNSRRGHSALAVLLSAENELT